MRSEAAAGRLDVRVEKQSLRDLWNIDASISDRQILQALTEVLRSETNPNVEITLQRADPRQCRKSMKALRSTMSWAFQANLALLYGDRVWRLPTEADAMGFGILTAYRMPRGSFRWGDEGLVRRYGIEVGRYSQSAERPAVWATV